jgi:hypothetical protein
VITGGVTGADEEVDVLTTGEGEVLLTTGEGLVLLTTGVGEVLLGDGDALVLLALGLAVADFLADADACADLLGLAVAGAVHDTE